MLAGKARPLPEGIRLRLMMMTESDGLIGPELNLIRALTKREPETQVYELPGRVRMLADKARTKFNEGPY